MKAKIRRDKNGRNNKPTSPRPANLPKGQQRKAPYAMDWTLEVEYATLWGKPIMSFTKKQLAAYVVFLINKHNEICERKDKVTFLRRGHGSITAGD